VLIILFAKVPRPGDNEVTFSVFKENCYVFYYQSNHSKVEAIPFSAKPKDTTSELAGLSSTIRFNPERQARKQ